MKKQTLCLRPSLLIILFILFNLIVYGCDSSSTSDSVSEHNVSGSAQKGPLQKNSFVKIYELDQNFDQNGRSFQRETTNDLGEYNVPNISSKYIELFVTGYYFDEIAGRPSFSTITLDAIADVSQSTTININILTCLAKKRLLKLCKEGMTFLDAEQQVKNEVLDSFGINNNSVDSFTNMNLLQAGESNAILLSISSIIMEMATIASSDSETTSAYLAQIISKIGSDIEDNGKLDDVDLIDDIKQATERINVSQVRDNLETYFSAINPNTEIPFFEKYIDSTITNDTLKHVGVVSANIKSFYPEKAMAISPDGKRVYAINSTGNGETIDVINTKNSTVIETITIQGFINSLVLSEDGSSLYAIVRGESILNEDSEHPIIIIDTTTNTQTDQIMLSTPPDMNYPDLAVVKGSILYVTIDGMASAVYAIDMTTKTVISTIDLNLSYPCGLTLSHDKSQLYLGSSVSNSITVINTSNHTLEKVIQVDDRTREIVPSPKGDYLYAEYWDGGIGIIDTDSRNVVDTIEMSTWGIALSPDGSRLYGVLESSGRVSLIDTLTNLTLTSVNMPNGSYKTVVVSPDGSRLYVPNTTTGELNIISTVSN